MLRALTALLLIVPMARGQGTPNPLAALESERLALLEALSEGSPDEERAAVCLGAARALEGLPPWYLGEIEGLCDGIVAAASLEPDLKARLPELLGTESSLEESPEAAVAELTAARTLLTTLLGPDHPCTLRRTFRLASHGRQSGDWERADDLFRRNVQRAARWRGAGGPEHARRLMDLGWHLSRTGRSKEADRTLGQAAEMLRDLGLPGLPVYRGLWMWLANYRGSVALDLGRVEEARAHNMDSVTTAAEVMGRSSYEYVMALNNLANCHVRMADYRGALALRYECVGRATATGVASSSDLAGMWFNLGATAQTSARPWEAIRAYGRVIELMEGRTMKRQVVALAASNRAILAMSVGAAETAAQSASVALEEFRALGPVQPRTRTSILEALVLASIRTGDLGRAAELCDEYENGGTPGRAAFYRGAIALREGRLEDADAAYLACLDAFETKDSASLSWAVGAHTERGRALLELGRTGDARAALSRAADLFEGTRGQLALGFGRELTRTTPYPLLARIALEGNHAEEMVNAIEAASARSLGDLLEAAYREADVEGARAAEELEVTARELRRDGRREGSVAEKQLRELEVRILEIRGRAARRRADPTSSAAFTVAELRGEMEEDEAFIGWFDAGAAGGAGVRAWVVTAKGGAAMVPVTVPRDAGSFAHWIHGAVDRLGAEGVSPFPPSESSARAQAEVIGERLLGGLLDGGHLEGIKHLHVAGPGLGAFPLESARLRDEWVDARWAVSYAPSCGLAVRLGGLAAPAGLEVVVIADPDFRGAKGLPPLPASRVEARRIGEVLEDALVLVGDDASEGRVRGLARDGTLSRASVVHIATHATVDEFDPAATGLALAQVDLVPALEATLAGVAAVDGHLSVPEILSRFRLDADLVTLSTCRSGLGVPIRGEGHVGLVAAFLQAGARSVVSSRWEVQDGATALFMGEFYRQLADLEGPRRKARALAGARRFLREHERDGARPFAHPGVWAAFTLTGCP